MNPDPLPDKPSDVDPEPAELAEPSDVDPEPAELAEPSDIDPEPAESSEPSDLDFSDMPCTDVGGTADESQWEVFLPDNDDWDPQPEPGDFWLDDLLLCSPLSLSPPLPVSLSNL